jgi:hypothetical protein
MLPTRATLPTTPHAHARAVREARASLRVEREYEDEEGVARALARLAELGVDEAGEPVAVARVEVAS